MTTELLQPKDNEQDISLLELLLVITSNLRLLFMTPVLAGLIGLSIAQIQTPEFESKAIQAGNSTLLAIYNSDQLRDAVIKAINFSAPGEDADATRKRFSKNLLATYNAKDKILTIVGKAKSAESAQNLVQVAIENAASMNKSQIAHIELLKQQIDLGLTREQEAAKTAAKMSQQIILSPSSNQAALAQAQAQLLEASRSAQTANAVLIDQMTKIQTFEIIQNPTLPTRKVWPSKSIFAFAAAFGTFLLVLIYVFFRFGLRRAYESNAATKTILDQISMSIRKSLGLSRPTI